MSTLLLGGIVACLLILSYQGFETLSAARAYVGGEGLWSKAQRDAVHSLLHYAVNHDSLAYQAFTHSLLVPQGDQQARLQLELKDPDYRLVREGFLQRRNHPEDMDRLATFFRRFRRVEFVDRAVRFWTQGDSLIAELAAAGSRLHGEIDGGSPDPARVQAVMTEVDGIRGQLAIREDAFSSALGEGSRRPGCS